jgi:hypothetical protein
MEPNEMSDINRTAHDARSDSDRSFTGEFVSFYDETFQRVNCSAAFEETYTTTTTAARRAIQQSRSPQLPIAREGAEEDFQGLRLPRL